jgi:xylulokinase
MSLMGVDIGSSRCKAVVFDHRGMVLAEAVEEYRPQFPGPAMVEMEADALCESVLAAIRAAASQAAEPVQAVGLSSHGESFVAVDGHNRPLAPAIMNADNRATAEAAWWEDTLGRERIFQTTGLIVHPMYPMAKLRWLRRHQPDVFSSAERFLCVSDYLLAKLGLEPCIAYPLACRMMAFDVRALRWSGEMLEAAEVSAERLATPVPAGTSAGALGRTAAGEIGVPAGTPVVVGGHDQPCGALGMGAIAPGMVTDSLGTYECLVAVAREPSLGPEAMAGSLNSYCHVVAGQYITIAYFPAGVMVKWFCDTCCGDQSAREKRGLYDLLEAQAPGGPTGLLITPHLIGSGNPHFDPRASGVIVGLRQTTTRGDIYKGILEGVSCELATIADLLADAVGKFDTIRCTGGGARSQLGLQLRATITGRRLQTLDTAESVCLGVALLAGVAAGVYRDVEEAVGSAVRLRDTICPDAGSASAYRSQVQQYRALYSALAPVRQMLDM